MNRKCVLLAGGWAAITALNMILLPQRYSPRVQVEALNPAPFPLIVRAPGQVEAKASVTIKAQFDGPVVSKRYREGDAVQSGQVLAVIGRDRIRLDYQARKDALVNAKADLLRARKEVRLQKTLFAQQAVAYSSVEEAEKALVRAAQARRSAEEAYRLEQIRWDSSTLAAPFAGTVVKDSLGDEKSVTTGREIAIVADVSEYTARVRVDELDIKRVSEGQDAEVRVQIFPQAVFKARVSQVGSQPESAESSAIPVSLLLTDLQGLLLRPKLTAEGRIFTGLAPAALSVPLSAVVNTDGTPKVWVVGRLKRITARPVELGLTNPERVEIAQGLKARAQVVVAAEPDFENGMRVILSSEKPSSISPSKTHARIRRLQPSGSKDEKKKDEPPSLLGVRTERRRPWK